MFRSEDCGIFIGLTTMPFGYEKDFYLREIKEGIFKAYRERLSKHMQLGEDEKTDTEFQTYLYQPKAYCLLGNFDLAIISLIDDFSLSSRVFHPFSSLLEDNVGAADHYYSNSFNYQTITGLLPHLLADADAPASDIINRALRTFLAAQFKREEEKSTFPLLGICSLKLTNSLVVGSDGELLDLCIEGLSGLIKNSDAYRHQHLDFIIINSFSWNELTILFFADSFQAISAQVLRLRELILGHLHPFEKSGELKKIIDNCLMSNVAPADRIQRIPLFSAVFTTLGYDHELMQHPEYFKSPPAFMKPWQELDKDAVRIYMRWQVKPGHLRDSLNYIPADEVFRVIAGRGDLVYSSEKKDIINVLEEVNKIIADSEKPAYHHVRNIHSIPEYYEQPEKLPGQIQPASNADQIYPGRKYTFTLEEINKLRADLKSCRISKILLDKLINIFVSYNDGIQDTVLYVYYIELWPYLEKTKRLAEFVARQRKENVLSIRDISSKFQAICSSYEKAHRNRFHQSYIMNEITDYNIEFNGGIQQLIAAYDMSYKTISRTFGGQHLQMPIAYVSSYSGVSSDLFSVKLNYYHIFHPEFFLAVATHEAVNFYLHTIESETEKLDRYTELYTLLRDPIYCDENDIPISVSYYLVDIVTFYVGYNMDASLFMYWHWGIFLATPLYYNTDGSINDNLFAQLLLRILLLFKSRDMEVGLSVDQPPCEQLAELWKKYFEVLYNLADELLARPDLAEWFSSSAMLAKTKVIDDFTGMKEKSSDEVVRDRSEMDEWINEYLIRQQRVKNEERFLNFYDDPVEREVMVILGRCQEMENIARGIMSAFKKGQLFKPRDFDLIFSESFRTHTFFYAYLKLLKEMNGDQLYVLKRGENGRPDQQETKAGALIFDSIGGMFTTKTKTRRKYFQYRSLLIATLMRMGNKNKKKVFEAFEESRKARD